MDVQPLALARLLLMSPEAHTDERGCFVETFREDALARAGFTERFVQENQVLTRRRGTVRGLHYQVAPHAQAKLVRVLRGAVFDVAVDLRSGSPTFGRHVAVELSAENRRQLLVPRGFAHGYQALSDGCEVLYRVSTYYAPEAERGLNWVDPALGIAWPIGPEEALVNARDAAAPLLADTEPQHG